LPFGGATQAKGHGHSWVKPGTSGQDLIYAVGGCNGTCVLSYPNGAFIAALPTGGLGICSDTAGNVFISDDNQVVEYQHGGTSPIRTLSLPGNDAAGCSVDPGTNTLAVVFKGTSNDIALFANEKGSPTLLTTGIDSQYCGYDGSGNLFVDGFSNHQNKLVELTKGSSSFTLLTISNLPGIPGQVQWDGTYITYQSVTPPSISRLTVSGSSASIVGTTLFKSINKRTSASWLYNNRAIIPYYNRGPRVNLIGLWKYPKGGKVQTSIRHFASYQKRSIDFQAVTLSMAP
jgi:hypothetical protein